MHAEPLVNIVIYGDTARDIAVVEVVDLTVRWWDLGASTRGRVDSKRARSMTPTSLRFRINELMILRLFYDSLAEYLYTRDACNAHPYSDSTHRHHIQREPRL